MSNSLSCLRCSWASAGSRRWWLALLPVKAGVIDRFVVVVCHSSSDLLIAVQSIRTVPEPPTEQSLEASPVEVLTSPSYLRNHTGIFQIVRVVTIIRRSLFFTICYLRGFT